MNIKYFFPAIIILVFSGCNTNTATSSNSAASSADSSNDKQITNTATDETADSIRHASLNRLTIANVNDPVCGMPMLRGFDDTTTYNGKLIGFCSKECKDKFAVKPTSYKIVYK